jgi:hypothetical protein
MHKSEFVGKHMHDNGNLTQHNKAASSACRPDFQPTITIYLPFGISLHTAVHQSSFHSVSIWSFPILEDDRDREDDVGMPSICWQEQHDAGERLVSLYLMFPGLQRLQ